MRIDIDIDFWKGPSRSSSSSSSSSGGWHDPWTALNRLPNTCLRGEKNTEAPAWRQNLSLWSLDLNLNGHVYLLVGKWVAFLSACRCLTCPVNLSLHTAQERMFWTLQTPATRITLSCQWSYDVALFNTRFVVPFIEDEVQVVCQQMHFFQAASCLMLLSNPYHTWILQTQS